MFLHAVLMAKLNWSMMPTAMSEWSPSDDHIYFHMLILQVKSINIVQEFANKIFFAVHLYWCTFIKKKTQKLKTEYPPNNPNIRIVEYSGPAVLNRLCKRGFYNIYINNSSKKCSILMMSLRKLAHRVSWKRICPLPGFFFFCILFKLNCFRSSKKIEYMTK